MLLLSKYIAKHEYKPNQKYFSIDDLIAGAKKITKGLGKKISISKKDRSFHFFKVRIGSKVKGRMIVFFVLENTKVVPLLIRLKKDKKIGMNMSPENPNVVSQINKNLDYVIKDIENDNFEEFEI